MMKKAPTLTATLFRVSLTASLVLAGLSVYQLQAQVQTFQDTLTGSGTYTLPTGFAYDITVEAWGGGGGGGDNTNSAKGGGGGGAYARKVITWMGNPLPYTVGAGGAAGAAGGNSTFNGTAVIAGGGSAGTTLGGAGGTFQAGDAGFSGGAGANAVSNTGGGGGGSAFTNAPGNAGSGSTGGTGQGNGGNGGSPGQPGFNPGGGGGGHNNGNSTSGLGANGTIIVSYQCEPPVFTLCVPAGVIVDNDYGSCAAVVPYHLDLSWTPDYAVISHTFTGATSGSGGGPGGGGV